MSRFEAMVDGEIANRGLPWSLRYLPVIESGYSPDAVSHAEAVGMWQFMAPTAGDFGIEVSPLVDDRRDPFVSTEAATDYLLQLRERFGSWFLALAAYNAGPDRVEGLLERYLPDVERSDAAYWALRKVLPEETANFVPNLLGAIIVASDPNRFGYEAPIAEALAFDRVPIRGSITFEAAARAAGTSRDEIARLNPEYVRGVTPPGRQVDLRLPPGTESAFRAYFAESAPPPTGR
jgi:membrane-bound lytic murein transglycosylase D